MGLIINGLITGAVFAIAASGLVLTYSTSGVFNFAHGALGMFCTYVYWDLRYNDDHHWPLLPEGRWPTVLALAAVLCVVAPVIGAVLHRVVIARLDGTAEVVRVVVPVSVLLAFVALANWIWKPDQPHSLQPFFGAHRSVTIGGVVLLWHDLTIVAVAVALAIGLRVLLTRTTAGIAMRAVVDNRELVQLNGIDSQRAATVSWMLGVSLSALAGILITPFQGGSLSATLLTLLVINAFAAAVVGRLRSLPLTFAGAVLLGFATRMAFNRPTGLMPRSWDWGTNFRLAVPMLLLFGALLALPQDRLRTTATRAVTRPRVPTVPRAGVWAVVMVIVVVALVPLLEPAPLLLVGEALSLGIIALSLVLLVGLAGELSLATMTFAGLGGTVYYHHVGHDVTDRGGVGAVLIAMAACAVIGALVALPALRLRGLYLALATAAFAVAVEQLVFKEYSQSRRVQPAVVVLVGAVTAAVAARLVRRRQWRSAGLAVLVGGLAGLLVGANGWVGRQRWSPIFPNGSLQVPRLEIAGVDLKDQDRFVIALAVLFALLGLGITALRNSGYGRRLHALHTSPAASATLGMDIVRLKLSVFMLSSAIAGLGGCLYAQQVGAVTAERFSLFNSMTLLMLAVVAGVGYVSGGLAAGLLHGAVFVVMRNVLDAVGEHWDALSGTTHWLGQFTAVLPALIGVGLGRNAQGFLDDAFGGWARSWGRRRRLVIGGLGVVAVVWVGALAGPVGNWAFALVAVGVLTVVPRLVPPARPARPVPLAERAGGLEALGIVVMPGRAERAAIDAALGLPGGADG